MPQASGRVTIKLNGESLRSKPGASLQIGGIQREYDVTDQLESYSKEKGVVAVIKCTMPHMADTDLIALSKLRDVTATFETDTGVVHTVPHAGVAELGDLQNGEVDITIMGDPAL